LKNNTKILGEIQVLFSVRSILFELGKLFRKNEETSAGMMAPIVLRNLTQMFPCSSVN